MTYKRIHLGPHSGHIPVQSHYFERNDQKKSNQIQFAARFTVFTYFRTFEYSQKFQTHSKAHDAARTTVTTGLTDRIQLNWLFFLVQRTWPLGPFIHSKKKEKFPKDFPLKFEQL